MLVVPSRWFGSGGQGAGLAVTDGNKCFTDETRLASFPALLVSWLVCLLV